MVQTFVIILIVLVAIAGAWFWYTHTPGYLAQQKINAAKEAALNATDSNGTNLQRGVYDTLDAAEAQRQLGVDVDPFLEGLPAVRNAYLAIPTKWQEERSTDVSDPVRRINIMQNLAGMYEATVQLFAGAVPYITSQAGMNAAKAFYLQMMTDAIDRRNCWWRTEGGCNRSWSVAEPHQNDRVLEEQNRIRDLSRRVLPAIDAVKDRLHLTFMTPTELARLHSALLGGDVSANPYDERTFTDIQGWLT